MTLKIDNKEIEIQSYANYCNLGYHIVGINISTKDTVDSFKDSFLKAKVKTIVDNGNEIDVSSYCIFESSNVVFSQVVDGIAINVYQVFFRTKSEHERLSEFVKNGKLTKNEYLYITGTDYIES